MGERLLVGEHEVDGLEGGHLDRVVHLDVLAEEGFGDLVGEGDALLEQLGLDLLHVEGVVVELDGVAVEAELVLLLVDGDELVLDHRDRQQGVVDVVPLPLDELDHLLLPPPALHDRHPQPAQLHVLQPQRLRQLLLRHPVPHPPRHVLVDLLEYVPDVHQL